MDKFQVMVYTYKDKTNYYRVNKIPSDQPNRPSQPNRIDTHDETMDESAFTQGHPSIEEASPKRQVPTKILHTNQEMIYTRKEEYQINTQMRTNEAPRQQPPAIFENNQVSPRNQTHRRMGPDPNVRVSNRKSNRENDFELAESRSDLQSLQDQDFQKSAMDDVMVEEPGHQFQPLGFNFQKKQAGANPEVKQAPKEEFEFVNNRQPQPAENYQDEPYFEKNEFQEEPVKSSPMPPANRNGLTPLEAYENFPKDRQRVGRKRLNNRTTEILKMRASDGENVLLLFLWRIEVERLSQEAEKMREKNNNLEGRLKRIEEKFREMRLDYEEKCDEVADLREQLDLREEAGPGGVTQIEILRERIELLEKEKVTLIRETEVKERELDDADNALQEKDDVIADLREQLERPRRAKSDPKLNRKIADLEDENEELASAIKDLRKQNKMLAAQGNDGADEKLKDLEEALGRLKKENRDLERDNENLADENAQMKKKQRASESKSRDTDELEKENEDLASQIKKLRRDHRDLEDEVEHLQAQVAKWKKKARQTLDEDAPSEDVEALKLKNKALENELKKLKEGKGKLGDERDLIQKANQRIVELVDQNNLLQNQLMVLQEELDEEREKEKETEGAKEMMNFYKKRAETLEVKSGAPSLVSPPPAEANEELELENRELREQLEKRKERVRELENENKAAREEIEKLKNKAEKENKVSESLRNKKRELDRKIREMSKNPDESARLRRENERLKSQLEMIEKQLDSKEKERDMLESSIIKTNEEVLRLKRLLAEKQDQIEDLQQGNGFSNVIQTQSNPAQSPVDTSAVERLEKKAEELTADNQQMGMQIEDMFKELEKEAMRTDNLRVQVMLLGTELERKSYEVAKAHKRAEEKETELIGAMKDRNSIKENVNRQMEKMLQENKQFGLEKEMEVNKLKMEKNKLLNYVDIYKKNTEEMERKITKLIQKHETLKEKYTAQQNLISSLQASDINQQSSRGENKVLLGKIKELEMKNRVLEIENQKLDEMLFEKVKEIEL